MLAGVQGRAVGVIGVGMGATLLSRLNLVGVQGEKPARLLEGRTDKLRLATATISYAQALSVSPSVVTQPFLPPTRSPRHMSTVAMGTTDMCDVSTHVTCMMFYLTRCGCARVPQTPPAMLH